MFPGRYRRPVDTLSSGTHQLRRDIGDALDEFRRATEEQTRIASVAMSAVAFFRTEALPLLQHSSQSYPLTADVGGRELFVLAEPADWDALVAHHGPADQWVMQSWIVRVYEFWELVTRKRLAALVGREPTIEVMGEMRLLRMDVVHHAGFVSRRRRERITQLAHWIQDDGVILPGFTAHHDLIDRFPWEVSAPEWSPA